MKNIKKNLNKYGAQFDLKDKMRASRASRVSRWADGGGVLDGGVTGLEEDGMAVGCNRAGPGR